MAIDLLLLSKSGTAESTRRLVDDLERFGFGVRSLPDDRSEAEADHQNLLAAVQGVVLYIDSDESSTDTEEILASARASNLPVVAVVAPGRWVQEGFTAVIPSESLSRGSLEAALGLSVQSTPAAPPVDAANLSGPPPVVGYARTVGNYPDAPESLIRQFVSSRKRAYGAIAFIGTYAISSIWVANRLFEARGMLDRDLSAALVTAKAAYNTGSLQACVFLVGIVPFLMWVNRAYKNLWALGNQDLPYTSAKATGGFFIPVMNLAISFNTLQAIWKGSSPDADFQDSNSWKVVEGSPLVWIWILGLIGANMLARASNTSDVDPDSAALQTVRGQLATSLMAGSISSVAMLISGVSLIALILLVIDRERKRYERYASEVAGVPVAPAGRAAPWLPACVLASMTAGVLYFGNIPWSVDSTHWKETTGSGFAVELPDEVSHSASEDGEETLASTLDGQHSIFQVTLDAEPAPEEKAETLKTLCRDSAKRLGVCIGEPKEVAHGGEIGQEVSFDVGEKSQPSWTDGRIRVFFHGRTTYMLISEGRPGGAFEADRKRFVDSFRFTD